MPMANENEQSPLVKITDLFGTAKPLEQLISAIERGIGNIMRPIQKRRETKADIAAYEGWSEALTKSGLAQTAAELTIGERATIRLTAETIRKQQNREFVAVEAVSEHIRMIEHQPDTIIPDIKIEEEWLDRFWRLAQDVSDKDMQTVWGRILARQAQAPTKYSARCLEALSLLSRQEALKLEKLSKYVCSTTIGNKPYHFFLLRPYRLNSDQESKEVGKKITEIIGDTYQSIFGPAGFYTDSGSGWAQSINIDVQDGVARLSIGKKEFLIGYPTSTTCADHIGAGLGVSPLGAEIFSLIEADPDPQFLDLFSSVLQTYGMRLERQDTRP
jgi:hypothetical protein